MFIRCIKQLLHIKYFIVTIQDESDDSNMDRISNQKYLKITKGQLNFA